MNQNRFTRLLVLPSSTSIVVAILASVAIMLIAGFTYATKNSLIFEYLYGSDSSAMLIENSRSSAAIINETILGNSQLNKILFFIFWMIIGLIAYVVISSLGSGMNSVAEIVTESKFIHAKQFGVGSELILKLILHTIGVGLLVIFSYIFITILFPFSILCARIVTGDLTNPFIWWYAVLGFVVLVLSIHLATILIRFSLLKPRIFGGYEDIIQDEIEHGYK